MSWVELNSSVLDAAAYQDHESVLELRFHGGAVYRYLDVPPHLYQALLKAESQGAFFNARIRNRFATALMPPENPLSTTF